MRAPPLFLAATVLIAILLLALFGVSALAPVNDTSATNAVAYAAPLDTPSVGFGNPVRGPATAKVTIVEFGDFQCEPCSALDASLTKILQEFPNDVRVAWKDFPNQQLHSESMNAAAAARCADRQGAFWQYHDLLLSRQTEIAPGAYSEFAAELGLSSTEFDACIETKDTEPLVERDFEEGQRLRVDRTPYLFVNGERVSGNVGYEQLKTYVTSALAK